PGWSSVAYDVVDTNQIDTRAGASLAWATPDNPSKRLIFADEATVAGASRGASNVLRYQIGDRLTGVDDDWHESSKAGSFHNGAWAADGQNSPAVDAGNLASPFGLETAPNGGRGNLGAYGKTPQASHPSPAYVQLISFIGGEKVRAGQASTIRWRSAGFAGNVKIEFSAN